MSGRMNFRAPLTSDKHFNKSCSRNVTQTSDLYAIPKLPYFSPSLYIYVSTPVTINFSNIQSFFAIFLYFYVMRSEMSWLSTSISHVIISNREDIK